MLRSSSIMTGQWPYMSQGSCCMGGCHINLKNLAVCWGWKLQEFRKHVRKLGKLFLKINYAILPRDVY
jgi:hypothetical protein